MQWQRALIVVFIGGFIFTGCEDFPIVEQPVTNLSLGFVTGLSGMTQPCECGSTKLGGLDRLVGLVDKRNRQNEFGLVFVGDIDKEKNKSERVDILYVLYYKSSLHIFFYHL